MLSSIREGRVDVCTQGHWASICYNEDLKLAGTICKMLGFPMQGNKMHNNIFKMKCTCYTGAMANSFIDPKVYCTVTDDGTTLNCGDTIQPSICDLGRLSITCQTIFSHAEQTLAALGAVIGLLVLLEVGTVIVWVACTVTKKMHSSSLKQRYLITWRCYNFFLSNRMLTKVNGELQWDIPKQPNVSSQDPNYDTVTTSNEAIGDYDVISDTKPNLTARALQQISNPPPAMMKANT